jgi:signal transduction histidine kinase
MNRRAVVVKSGVRFEGGKRGLLAKMNTNKMFAWFKDKSFADPEIEKAYQLKNAKIVSLFMRVVWIPVLIAVTALVIRDVITAPKGSFGDLSTLLRMVALLITFGLLWTSKIPKFQNAAFVRKASDFWTLAIFIIIFVIAFSRKLDSAQDYYRTIISFLITIPIVGVFYKQPFQRVAPIFGVAWLALFIVYFPLAKTNLEAYLSGHIAIFAITVLSGTLTTLLENSGREAFLANRTNELQTNKIADESRRKTEFLSALSHDLRQPLTGLIGYLELARRVTSRESFNREVDDYIVHAQKGANAIQSNLIRVLELARLEDYQHTKSCESVGLNRIFRMIGDMFEAKAHVDQIKLKIIVDAEPGLFVESDADLLFQILQNLVANAIAYRRNGILCSWILLTCIRVKRDQIRISVIDNGVGIPPEQLTRVFEPYYQLNNPSRNVSKGVGLGLTFIDRAIKKLSNHELKVQSNGRTYTRFDIYLPKTAAPKQPKKMLLLNDENLLRDEKYSQLVGSRILVLEDDEEIRMLITSQFRAAGATVFSASGYEHYERELKSGSIEQPTLIITDQNLEGPLTGINVVTTIRTAFNKNIPAILITALSVIDTEIQTTVQASLQKPFQLIDLMRITIKTIEDYYEK